MWISVKDELPEIWELVWVYNPVVGVFLAYKTNESLENWNWRKPEGIKGTWEGFYGGDLWQPLTTPNPPVNDDESYD